MALPEQVHDRLIAFGHTLLAMSGEESLAQVYREIKAPKVPNLLKAGAVIALMRGERPEIRSDGSPSKGYLHVSDIVSAYMLLGERAAGMDVGAPSPIVAVT